MKKIIINGREYNSIDEVPELMRQYIKDDNNDGIPDIAEKAIKKGQGTHITNAGFNSTDLQNMSPADKERLRQVIQKNKKLLQNPMLGALIKGVSGMDPNEVVNNINKNLSQSASKTPSKQIRSTATPKSPIQQSQSQSHYQPPSSFRPGVKKDTGHTVMFFLAVIGFIGWLLYTYTDII